MAKSNTKRVSKRVPVSGNRDVLTVRGKEDGFNYRWVNDVDDGRRMGVFEKAGYEFVEKDGVSVGDITVDVSDRSTRSSVVQQNVGGGVTAFLMRQPTEWYDEDQANKQKDIADREVDMKRKLNSGADGGYGNFDIT